MKIFKELSDEYEFNRQDAIRKAEEIEGNTYYDHKNPDEPPVRFDSPNCDNPTLVINEDSKTGYLCTFCENEESDELPAICANCGDHTIIGELGFWVNEDGLKDGRCYICSGRYQLEKND